MLKIWISWWLSSDQLLIWSQLLISSWLSIASGLSILSWLQFDWHFLNLPLPGVGVGVGVGVGDDDPQVGNVILAAPGTAWSHIYQDTILFIYSSPYLAVNLSCNFCVSSTFCELLALGDKGKDCLSFNKQELSSVDSSSVLDHKLVSIVTIWVAAHLQIQNYEICPTFSKPPTLFKSIHSQSLPV